MQCDAGIGTNALFEQLYRKPPKLLVLGAGCSAVSEATAQVSHLWNLVQVCDAMYFLNSLVYSYHFKPKLHYFDLLRICCGFVVQQVVQQIRNKSK